MRYMPTLRLPDFASFGDHAGQRNERPAILRPCRQHRQLAQVDILALQHTCLHGASARSITFGKKLPTSASIGSSFSLSSRPVGVGGCKQRANALRDLVQRLHVKRQLHAALGAELVHQHTCAGMPVTFSNRRAGPPAPCRGVFKLRRAIRDLCHLEVG